MSEREHLDPHESLAIVDKVMDMKQYPWFTEHIAEPLMAKFWEKSGRHPNFWVKPDHLDRLPEEPFIAAVKHSDNDDSIAVQILLRGHQLMVPANLYLFDKNPIQTRVYRAMGAIPLIAPEWLAKEHQHLNNWEQNLEEMEKHLAEGKTGLIYPEGTRSPTLNKIGRGASQVAARARVPIVPIGLANTHIKGSPLAAYIGEPVLYPVDEDGVELDERAARVFMHHQLREAFPAAHEGAYQLLADQTNQTLADVIPQATAA